MSAIKMMKKINILILLLLSLSLVFAQENNLENYQVTAFNGVTRLSFTFTQRPITNVKLEANDHRLTISIPNCGISGVPTTFTTTDIFARSIIMSRQNRDLNIVISTAQPFEIRQSGSQGRQYTVHIDMFRTSNPRELTEFTSMIDFFNHTGNRGRVNELIALAQSEFPNNQQITNRAQGRFSAPRVYSPQRTVAQTPATRPTLLNISLRSGTFFTNCSLNTFSISATCL